MAKAHIYGTLKSVPPSGNRKIFLCTVIKITVDIKIPFIHQTATRRLLFMHILPLSNKSLRLKNNNKYVNDESRRQNHRRNE